MVKFVIDSMLQNFITSFKKVYYALLKVSALLPVLRIRDIYPGSRILILPIPDPGSRIPDPKNAELERGEMRKKII
jgi:hypothetical protein